MLIMKIKEEKAIVSYQSLRTQTVISKGQDFIPLLSSFPCIPVIQIESLVKSRLQEKGHWGAGT